jgi:hypothetical protein
MHKSVLTIATAPIDIRYKWDVLFSDMQPEHRKHIQLDTRSLMNVNISNVISLSIIHMLETSSLTVLDFCAGVGVNTIGFLKWFNHVTAVESDLVKYGMLKHNTRYDKFVNAICVDSQFFVKTMPYYDVVYVDQVHGVKTVRELLKHSSLVVLKLDRAYDTTKLDGIGCMYTRFVNDFLICYLVNSV